MEFNFKEELSYCPEYWRYVPLDGAKAPNEKEFCPKRKELIKGLNWGKKPYTLEEVCTKPKQAVGLFLGPVSRTAALDFDGPDSDETFDFHFGNAGELWLPDTLANSSGRDDHYQIFFEVPESWNNKLKTIKLKPPEGKNWGKVELRWGNEKAIQSVLLGKHPNKKRYNWETGIDEEVPVGTGDGQGFYSWCIRGNPKEQRLALMPTKLLEIWAEKSNPSKVILPDRPKTSTVKSIDQHDPTTKRYENRFRLKKGLEDWFIKPEHYDYETWIQIGMEVKSLGWEDYGDPDKFWNLFNEWSSKDPIEERYEGTNKTSSKWESFSVGGEGDRTFASFIHRAIEEGFLGPKDLPKTTKDNPPKKPVDFLEAATSSVEIIEKGWEKISTLPRPSQRTAALEILQKEANLSHKAFRNVVQDLIAESNTDNKNYSTFEDLMNAKDLKQEALVDRLIPKGNLVILAAEGGTGKSTFCYEIAEAVSTGNKLFGQLDTSKGNVKVVQCDESPTDAQVKFDIMDYKPNNANLTFKWDFNPSMLPDLEKEIERDKSDLCIMDSLVKIFGGGNDLNTPEVGLYMYQLNQIASRTRCTFLIPHHLKKDQTQQKKKGKDDTQVTKEVFRNQVTKDDLYGNVFIFNGASDVWGFWVAGKDSGQKMYRLKILKNRSQIAPSDHLYQLKGCEETLRYSIPTRSNGDLDKAHSIEKAALLFLENNRPNKYSKKDIYKNVSEARGFSTTDEHLGAMLRRLYNNRAVTGIDRCPSSENTGGRPPHLYFKR